VACRHAFVSAVIGPLRFSPPFLFAQAFVYMCIQEFGFLDPRITKHPSYPKVKAAHKAKKAQDLMLHVVRPHAALLLSIASHSLLHVALPQLASMNHTCTRHTAEKNIAKKCMQPCQHGVASGRRHSFWPRYTPTLT